MDQSRIAAIVGASIMATTIADKAIERFWPNRRVNSILDAALLLLKGVQGALAAEKTARRKRSRSTEVVVQAGETGVVEEIEDLPTRTLSAMAELLDSVREGSAASSPPPAAPASRPEYWEREDIKAWAAAHPQLARALKRKHGLL